MTNRTIMMKLLGLGAAIGLSSCSMNRAGGGITSYQVYDRPAKLPTNPAAVRVKVSLSKQRAYVIEGDEMLLAMPISVGNASTPTPIGDFRIFNKEAKRREHDHGYARGDGQIRQTNLRNKPSGWSFRGTPTPYWCEFKPAYGFHTGWVKHTPCTNGCIRMHENVAPKFFHLVSVGTPVNISYSQPEDAKWTSMKLPPDAGPLPDYPLSMYYDGGYFTHHKAPEFN